FNNVLAAIRGRAQLLRRRVLRGELAADDLLGSLAVIERVSHDGGETVRRLRQFAKGDAELTSEAIDLDAVVREAAEFTRTRWEDESQAAGRHIAVVIESRPGARVVGRGSELREVFTNLILNAVDALPRGGTILLVTETAGDRVRARVED